MLKASKGGRGIQKGASICKNKETTEEEGGAARAAKLGADETLSHVIDGRWFSLRMLVWIWSWEREA